MNDTTAAATAAQLLEDTLFHLRNLKGELEKHLAAVREQRRKHPHSEPYVISEKTINQLTNQIFAITELGKKIESEKFTNAGLRVETLLKKLRIPIQFRREDILNDVKTIVDELEQQVRKK